MCLSGNCSVCNPNWTFEKETKPMVDLTKPLTVKDWGDFHYIGKNRQGELVVESAGGVMHRVSPNTFRILSTTSSRSYYLENKLEPWEEAFLSHTSFRSKFMTEEEYFKHVFELGRSWK
jgi:hypothetical protein